MSVQDIEPSLLQQSYRVGSGWVGGPTRAPSKYQTVEPPPAAGMMLPSNMKTGSAERSAGRQKPLAGQWKPVFAIRPGRPSEILRIVLIFFTERSQFGLHESGCRNFSAYFQF